ncbi:MAG: cobalt ECF transporter T component CbiQ [Phascolarctobacterium sp.]
MNKINRALQEINQLNTLAQQESVLHRLHPLTKLLVTVGYIALLMSWDKYELLPLLCLGIFPLWGLHLGGLSLKSCLWRVRLLLPLLCLVGIANPFFDQHCFVLGDWQLKAGYISFLTLMLKGLWALLASYLLIATTSIEQLCYALRLLHLPKILVTQFLLTYRYLTLLLEQADTMAQAYALRAPKQKGIHFKVWGSLAGQLLLRSIDRANNLYASMLLRGYQGEYYYGGPVAFWSGRDWCYLVGVAATFIIMRLLPWSLVFTKLMGGTFR